MVFKLSYQTQMFASGKRLAHELLATPSPQTLAKEPLPTWKRTEQSYGKAVAKLLQSSKHSQQSDSSLEKSSMSNIL